MPSYLIPMHVVLLDEPNKLGMFDCKKSMLFNPHISLPPVIAQALRTTLCCDFTSSRNGFAIYRTKAFMRRPRIYRSSMRSLTRIMGFQDFLASLYLSSDPDPATNGTQFRIYDEIEDLNG